MDDMSDPDSIYPTLDAGAPPVAVIFERQSDAAASKPRATIYVRSDEAWICVFEAPYVRGVQRVGRGGRGHVYRLVSDDGPIAELAYRSPRLVITTRGERQNLFYHVE